MFHDIISIVIPIVSSCKCIPVREKFAKSPILSEIFIVI